MIFTIQHVYTTALVLIIHVEGDFHKCGYPQAHRWMVYFMENTIYKWMIFWGTPSH
jgi:hypothetical protein